MRPTTLTAVSLVVLCGAILAGCVVAVTPLHHQFSMNDNGGTAVTPVAEHVEAKPEKSNRESRLDEACQAGPEPVHDKRPVVPTPTAAQAEHPDEVNQILLDYIKSMDVYLASHQKKEQDHYDKWLERCKPAH